MWYTNYAVIIINEIFLVCRLRLKYAAKQLLFILFFIPGYSLFAQEIFIHQRSNLVMNGTVSMVVNNAAFKNDGVFSEANSTVQFSGYQDTLTSYVSGLSNTRFNNLTINKTANGTAIKSTAGVVNTLGVYGGNLYADSNLTLLSDANLTARVDMVTIGSNIIGKVKVERYIPSRRAWRLLTGPVTAATSILGSWQNEGVYGAGKGTLVTGLGASGTAGNGLDISPRNNTSLRKWDYLNQVFSNVLNTKVPLSEGSSGTADNTGYFIFVRGDRDVNNYNISNSNTTTLTSIGNLQTGTQTFAVSAQMNKYSLIGNPFASPINFNNVIRNNVINRFYVWNPNLNTLGGYVELDDLLNTGSYIAVPSIIGGPTKDIQSSEAFFVQTLANGAASITFNENSKSAVNINSIFRPMAPTGFSGTTSSLRTNIYLKNTDGSTLFADGNLAQFNNFFSDSVQSEDAIKFINTNENIAFARHGFSLAAERRPAINNSDTLFLKLWNTTKRAYQLEFMPENFDNSLLAGYLQDKYLNTSTVINLTATSLINFSIDANAASAAADRFKIVFKQNLLTPLPVTLVNFTAYQKNNDVATAWEVENEINMLQYDVEKSTDGTQFVWANTTKIGGSNNSRNSYTWLDKQPNAGNNFYRIKMVSRNGTISYSSVARVTLNTKNIGITVYPNPIKNNAINLQLTNQRAGIYHLTLTNNVGQVYYTGTLQNNGSGSYLLNIENKLLAGVYYLQIEAPENVVNTQKIIVE